MNYENLVELQREYIKREDKWLDGLIDGAESLKNALLERMGIPETYLNSAGRTVPYVRLLEAQSNQTEAEKLSRKNGLAVLADGTLPIAVELGLRVGLNLHLVYMYVGLREESGEIHYALWDLPDAYGAKTKNWRSLVGILRELELELGKYFAHDPRHGDRDGLSII